MEKKKQEQPGNRHANVELRSVGMVTNCMWHKLSQRAFPCITYLYRPASRRRVVGVLVFARVCWESKSAHQNTTLWKSAVAYYARGEQRKPSGELRLYIISDCCSPLLLRSFFFSPCAQSAFPTRA